MAKYWAAFQKHIWSRCSLADPPRAFEYFVSPFPEKENE
jgi:hypothetical protein